MKALLRSGQNRFGRIKVGAALEELEGLAAGRRAIVLCDDTVRRLHGKLFPSWPVIEIGSGEPFKTLTTVAFVHRRLLELGADRTTLLVGVGGGVVCDMTGFVASTYMRGMPFAFAATTLLAQVDAAIGGKNGVNLDGFKNLIGTFRQPEFVLSDFRMLSTLPRREILCGLAETIKAAAIADRGFFFWLERCIESLLKLDMPELAAAVKQAVAIKTAIVRRDETERGERRVLNFGHTLGHALEKTSSLTHGEAVAIGMVAAARLSRKKRLLDGDDCHRLEEMIGRCGLPTAIPGVDRPRLLQAMRCDKKKEGDILHLVLLKRLGRADVFPVALTELEEVLP